MAQPYIVIYSASSFWGVGFFMRKCEQNSVSTATKTRRVDIVIVDGAIACELANNIEKRGLVVDAYSRPSDLLANLSKYSKDTRISFGYVFNGDIWGLELAKRLHEAGYVNLYMLTWSDFKFCEIPYYVKHLPKSGDYEHDVDRLLSDEINTNFTYALVN